MDKNAELFIKYLEHQISATEAGLERFMVGLKKDAAHALEWSQDAFQTAATRKVAESAIRMLEGGASLVNIYKYALDKALHSAKFPQHSSSYVSNYMYLCMGSAWAELAEQAEAFNSHGSDK